MSSSITSLPTLDNTKPELTRPRVPDAVLNKLLQKETPPRYTPAEPQKTAPQKEPRQQEQDTGPGKRPEPKSPVTLAGASVVALQAQESIKAPSPLPAQEPLEKSDQTTNSAALNELSDEELAFIKELQARDEEVRRHENAHKNAGGSYAGSPEYSYTRGPDGRRYAISGKVSIDTSAVPGDPEATVEKMRIVQSAALAPASPSGADRAVAARAAEIAREAEAELQKQRTEEKEAELDQSNKTVSEAGELDKNNPSQQFGERNTGEQAPAYASTYKAEDDDEGAFSLSGPTVSPAPFDPTQALSPFALDITV